MIETFIRFRTHHYALKADIEKPFLHITVDRSDRNALSFLLGEKSYDKNFWIKRMRVVNQKVQKYTTSSANAKHLEAVPRMG